MLDARAAAASEGRRMAATTRHLTDSYIDDRPLLTAKPVGVPEHGVVHRLQIGARRADRIEHVDHRGLPFERRVEVVEQFGVADGD